MMTVAIVHLLDLNHNYISLLLAVLECSSLSYEVDYKFMV